MNAHFVKSYTFSLSLLLLLVACGETADDVKLVSINDKLIEKLKEYDSFGDFAEGRVIVGKDERYGFVNCDGKAVTPLAYSYAKRFKHGVAIVDADKGAGLIDRTGREIVPYGKYDYLEEKGEDFYLAGDGDKVGILDRTGKLLVPLEFETIETFDEDFYLAQGNSEDGTKCCLFDRNWEIVLPQEYNSIKKFSEDTFLVSKEDDNFGLVDISGNVIVPLEFNTIKKFDGNHYLAKKGGKEAVLDSDGKPVSSFKYNKIETSGNLYRVFEEGRCGLISKVGEEVLPCIYDGLSYCGENIYCVENDNKWGFFDETGKQLTPFIYDVVPPDDYQRNSPYESYHYYYEFLDGFCTVRRGGKWGIIDKTGNEIIPCSYQLCFQMKEGAYAAIKQGDKYGIIDRTGKMVVPCEYDYSGVMGDKIAYLKKGGKTGLVRIVDGKMLTDFKYWSVYDFGDNGLAHVIMEVAGVKAAYGRMSGLLNKDGKEVVPCEFQDLNYLPDSSAVYGWNYKAKKYVLVNLGNGQQTTTDYDYIQSFEKGTLAEVRKDRKCGFVDGHLKEVVPCIYDGVHQYDEGVLHVKKDGKQGYLDMNGKEIISCKYDWVEKFKDGFCYACKDGLSGCVDMDGNEFVPLIYKEIDMFDGDFARVKLNGKMGYVDKNGKEIVPCVFDKCERLSDGSFRLETTYTFFKDDSTRQEHDAKLYGYAFPDGTITFDEGTIDLLLEQAYEDEIDRREAEARWRARYEEKQAQKEKERIQRLKEDSQWLQGSWRLDYNSPAGRIASYTLTIQGDYALLKHNGKTEYEGKYDYDGSSLKFGKRKIVVNNKRHTISMEGDFHVFTKTSGTPVTSNVNFRFDQDVFSYLSGKTFYGIDGKDVRVEPNGVYINGSNVMSGAPMVKSFTSSSAIVQISIIPSGTLLLQIYPREGRIVDNSGTSYYHY